MATHQTTPLELDHGDQGPRIIASMVVLIVLPTIFVGARFTSRALARAGFWLDDLFIAIALTLAYGPCFVLLYGVRHDGLGKHIYDLQPKNGTDVIKGLYAYTILYCLAVTAVKLAILTFYVRIYKEARFRWVIYGAGIVVTCWGLSSTLAIVFGCTPIRRFWDRQLDGHCTDLNEIWLTTGALNCVLDALIIFLPVPLLWRLRTSRPQKKILTMTFLSAGFVCVISVIRLTTSGRLGQVDPSWTFANSGIWSAAEASMGVIAGCIPSLCPLASLIFRGTVSAIGSSKLSQTTRTKSFTTLTSIDSWSGAAKPKAADVRLKAGVYEGTQPKNMGHVAHAQGPETQDHSHEGATSVPLGNIMVEREVTVTSTDWIEYQDKVY